MVLALFLWRSQVRAQSPRGLPPPRDIRHPRSRRVRKTRGAPESQADQCFLQPSLRAALAGLKSHTSAINWRSLAAAGQFEQAPVGRTCNKRSSPRGLASLPAG